MKQLEGKIFSKDDPFYMESHDPEEEKERESSEDIAPPIKSSGIEEVVSSESSGKLAS